MTDADALLKIERAIALLPSQHGGWLQSISIQLQYCSSLIRGTVGSERVKEINMGYMAVREYDGYDEGTSEFELTELICEIDCYVKDKYLTYAEKVGLGIHRRS